jgi:hypothetical protein
MHSAVIPSSIESVREENHVPRRRGVVRLQQESGLSGAGITQHLLYKIA